MMCIAIIPLAILLVVILITVPYNGRKSVYFMLFFVNTFIFLTILTFGIHYAVSVVTSDLCREVDYQKGVLYLLFQDIFGQLDALETAGNNFLGTAVNLACGYVDNICNQPYQVCQGFPCNLNILLYYANFSILDTNGTMRTVLDCGCNCPNQCVDPNLRNFTAQFDSKFGLYTTYLELVAYIDYLRSQLLGTDSLNLFNSVFCTYANAVLAEIYSGATLMLVGLVALAILCFVLAS